MKTFLFICAASALCIVSSLPARQYHFVHEPKPWTEAQSYCREKFVDLATIDNMEDVEILNNMADSDKIIQSSDGYLAWIGLYYNVSSWRWSMSDSSFYKDNEAEFRNWAGNEPNNYGKKECCTMMTADGEWNDVPCSNSFTSVCFDVKGQNVTFTFVNEAKTFPEAQSYCRKHHTDLASVRNMAENQKVMKLIPRGQKVLIGLFRDSWKWVDGSNSSFSYWKKGESFGPGEYCTVAVFRHSGKWGDLNCDHKNAFICYSAPVLKQVVKVKLERSSSLDLNDPAVQEDLLKQLKLKLRDQRVKTDMKLSWRKRTDGTIFYKEEKDEH